jgi:hypothetical protein
MVMIFVQESVATGECNRLMGHQAAKPGFLRNTPVGMMQL